MLRQTPHTAPPQTARARAAGARGGRRGDGRGLARRRPRLPSPPLAPAGRHQLPGRAPPGPHDFLPALNPMPRLPAVPFNGQTARILGPSGLPPSQHCQMGLKMLPPGAGQAPRRAPASQPAAVGRRRCAPLAAPANVTDFRCPGFSELSCCSEARLNPTSCLRCTTARSTAGEKVHQPDDITGSSSTPPPLGVSAHAGAQLIVDQEPALVCPRRSTAEAAPGRPPRCGRRGRPTAAVCKGTGS
jgi:hypothetical protein